MPAIRSAWMRWLDRRERRLGELEPAEPVRAPRCGNQGQSNYIPSEESALPWPDPTRERGRMFIAMNRFAVRKGSDTDFEEVWLGRDIHIDGVPGFVEFHLLKGPEREDHVLYASHTVWESREAFEAWTRSEAFRAAHRDAGGNKPLYLGHPMFEGFEVVQTVAPRRAGG